jgi:BlaI family penicillinase repressor
MKIVDKARKPLDTLQCVEYDGSMKLLILSKHGRFAPLSDELELPLMEILWANGPMKGKDLHEEIRRKRDIAYTTALTVLDRLSKKGLIKKDRKSGTILFTPAISRQAYERAITESFVQKAFDVSPDLAVSAFAGMFSKRPGAEFEKLEKLLEEKKNGEHQG